MTFVDHTRNLMRHYEGSATHAEYVRRLDFVREQGVTSFVTKLRSYLLRYRLPDVGVSVSFDQANGLTVKSFLNRDRALAWKDWPTLARTYLEQQPELVGLADVIHAYAALIEDLYRWLYEQFPVLHGADVDAVNALIIQTPGWRHADGSTSDPEGWPDPPKA